MQLPMIKCGNPDCTESFQKNSIGREKVYCCPSCKSKVYYQVNRAEILAKQKVKDNRRAQEKRITARKRYHRLKQPK